MPEPHKVLIAQKAVEFLEEATRSNGYWTDLGKNVGRRKSGLADQNVSNFPTAFVYYAANTDSEVECIGALYRTTALLIVEGFLRAADIEDEVIRFEADVYRALLSPSRTLDGTCEEIKPAGWRADWMEQTDFDRGVSRVAFEVTYSWDATDP